MKKYLFYISQNYSFAILRPVQEILKRRGDQVTWFFEGDQVDPAYVKSDEDVLPDMPSVMRYQADATLAPSNSIPSFLPGLKVATFHGFDAGKVDRKGKNDHFKVRGCFDLYCTQGPNTTSPFKQLQRQYGFFNVIETGWPTLDPLFRSSIADTNDHRRPTILFCSTFSKNLSCAEQVFPKISELSRSNKWQWLVQFHPKMSTDTVEKYKSIENENLRFIETDNVIPLLARADVMLCDTSSVILMFLTQQKPVVTFNNIDPGPQLINIDTPDLLEASLELALQKPADLISHIKQYSDTIHPYNDGQSAQRMVQAIDNVLTGEYPVKPKPLSIRLRTAINNLKFRSRLGYWKYFD